MSHQKITKNKTISTYLTNESNHHNHKLHYTLFFFFNKNMTKHKVLTKRQDKTKQKKITTNINFVSYTDDIMIFNMEEKKRKENKIKQNKNATPFSPINN